MMNSAATTRATPTKTRAYDAQPPLPKTSRAGFIRPVVSQRSRWTSSACRHSRPTPTTPITIDQKTAPWPSVACTSRIAPRPSVASTISGPDVAEPAAYPRAAAAAGGALGAGRVGLERGVGREEQPPAGVQRDAEPAQGGRDDERRPAPRAPAAPRWRARPAATPPMMGASVSRVARRYWYVGVRRVGRSGRWSSCSVPASQSEPLHPMRKHPETTLSRSPRAPVRLRVVPDGVEALRHDEG